MSSSLIAFVSNFRTGFSHDNEIDVTIEDITDPTLFTPNVPIRKLKLLQDKFVFGQFGLKRHTYYSLTFFPLIFLLLSFTIIYVLTISLILLVIITFVNYYRICRLLSIDIDFLNLLFCLSISILSIIVRFCQFCHFDWINRHFHTNYNRLCYFYRSLLVIDFVHNPFYYYVDF